MLIAAVGVGLIGGAAPADASAAGAAALAHANVGKTAGTCANTPMTNTLGGTQFDGSCTGGGSGIPNGPESWCADFARWVWGNSGINTAGLTSAAQSFYTYGQTHGTFQSSVAPGDAVVFASSPTGYAKHVGIVTSVGASSFVVANGNWSGSGSGEAWSVSSHVREETVPLSQGGVGSFASAEDYYVKAIVAPSGTAGSGAPPGGGGNPYSPSAVCGSDYGIIDSHHLTGATIFLLYSDSTGNNCVVTLADADTGSVPMNATLAVQGGSSGSDNHNYDWYAGPVIEHAPDSCVKWGGTYKTSTWTSDYSHCGAGTGSPAPVADNPYSPEQVCGSGYSVIDQHALSGATVYLLYSDASGDNCVTTMVTNVGGSVAMNATLSVQGGSSASDPHSYTYYAGPVYEYAPNSCVAWGGAYGSSSWTSAYGHCGGGSGGGAANPYTAAGVCGSGYSVIDSHNLGSATIYLLYNAGYNCVVTLVHSGGNAVGLNATLSVQGGGSGTDPGLYDWYAGPIRLSAAGKCVSWGGTYESTSWTSGWTHCG
jgi:hypothetical protein